MDRYHLLLRLCLLRPLQTDNQRDFELEFFCGLDDALGDNIASHAATKGT